LPVRVHRHIQMRAGEHEALRALTLGADTSLLRPAAIEAEDGTVAGIGHKHIIPGDRDAGQIGLGTRGRPLRLQFVVRTEDLHVVPKTHVQHARAVGRNAVRLRRQVQ